MHDIRTTEHEEDSDKDNRRSTCDTYVDDLNVDEIVSRVGSGTEVVVSRVGNGTEVVVSRVKSLARDLMVPSSLDKTNPAPTPAPTPGPNPDVVLGRIITKNVSKTVAHHLAKEYITQTLQYPEITFSTIIDIITDTAQFVEKYRHLTGPERKVVVVESVVVYLEHVVEDAKWRDQLVGFVDLVGPHLIDVVVYASKGKFKINRKTIRRALSKLTCGCVSPYKATDATLS